jgi:hypothetical protein
VYSRKPFGGEAVDVRGADLLLAVAAEVGVAEFVGEDEDDVWLAARRIRGAGGGGQ